MYLRTGECTMWPSSNIQYVYTVCYVLVCVVKQHGEKCTTSQSVNYTKPCTSLAASPYTTLIAVVRYSSINTEGAGVQD